MRSDIGTTRPNVAERVVECDFDFHVRILGKKVRQALGDQARARQGEGKPEGQTNQRNGTSGKTVITDDGPLLIEVPRDRAGAFEPQIIGKHERRFTGFDQKIIAMHARGMTVREIQGYLAEMYGTEVSPEFISKVTDEVTAEKLWVNDDPTRALEQQVDSQSDYPGVSSTAEEQTANPRHGVQL